MKKIYLILFSLITVCTYAQYNNTQTYNCNNVGFETDTTTNWTLQHANITGHRLPCNDCPNMPGAKATVVTTTTSIGTQCANGVDLYGGFSIVAPAPLGGTHSLLLNNDSAGGKMQQASFTVTASPSTSNFTYQFAVVLKRGTQIDTTTPYFSVYAIDDNTQTILPCPQYNSDTSTHIAGWQTSTTDPSVSYLNWQTMTVDLDAIINNTVTIFFTASDGSNGNSFGYAYIDASCYPLQISVDPSLCPGASATLHGPPGFATYNWAGGSVTGTSQNLTTSTPANYTLTTTSAGGCSEPYLYYNLTLNPEPMVSCTITQNLTSNTCTIYPTYSYDVVQYSWDWGDGSPLNSSAYPSHIYATPGNYTVCVTSTNDGGCSATYCVIDSVTNVNVINGNQTTGINKTANANAVTIYPNPTNGIINLQMSNYENATVEVYSVIGQKVYTQQMQNNLQQLNLSSVADGVYQLRVMKNNTSVFQTKIIKQ